MLRIECVYCGVCDEEEFTFGGPGHVTRPDPQCNDAEWADYLFNRANPKGVHYERWCHSFGCRRWFNVARNTVTHEILVVYHLGEPKPDLNVREDRATADPPHRDGMAGHSSRGGPRSPGRLAEREAER